MRPACHVIRSLTSVTGDNFATRSSPPCSRPEAILGGSSKCPDKPPEYRPPSDWQTRPPQQSALVAKVTNECPPEFRNPLPAHIGSTHRDSLPIPRPPQVPFRTRPASVYPASCPVSPRCSASPATDAFRIAFLSAVLSMTSTSRLVWVIGTVTDSGHHDPVRDASRGPAALLSSTRSIPRFTEPLRSRDSRREVECHGSGTSEIHPRRRDGLGCRGTRPAIATRLPLSARNCLASHSLARTNLARSHSRRDGKWSCLLPAGSDRHSTANGPKSPEELEHLLTHELFHVLSNQNPGFDPNSMGSLASSRWSHSNFPPHWQTEK
jgi:hypothetical protein